jgi:glutaredoxin
MILKAFRVAVDEKDISMDSSYRKELQNALGEQLVVTLPQVFIRGKHVGNAEEIKLLMSLVSWKILGLCVRVVEMQGLFLAQIAMVDSKFLPSIFTYLVHQVKIINI